MARRVQIILQPGARLFAAIAGFVSLLALALRLYRLDAQSLWLDEGGTWAEISGRTGKGWLALFTELFSPNAGYPLYHLILKAWVAIAGDSEWALRFPSALAGALAVLVMVLAAAELTYAAPGVPTVARRQHWRYPLVVGLLGAVSPYALWHSQDAKVYSLLILCAALLLWMLLRALRLRTSAAWGWFIIIAVISIFVHRLALLLLAGAALAIAVQRGKTSTIRGNWQSLAFVAGAVAIAIIGVGGTLLAAHGERPGSAADIGPLTGLWFSFARFSLDRWPGELDGYLALPGIVWLAPFAALSLWGLALLLRDARAGDQPAIAILSLLIAPLALFALAHTLAPVYQTRYAAPAFPAWLLALAYPLSDRYHANTESVRRSDTPASNRGSSSMTPQLSSLLIALAFTASITTLMQPNKGLFSGAPLKEQWREAVTALARRVHPDDLVLLHPYYVEPLYAYYAPRVTPDPLPRPVTFPIFAEGDTCGIAEPSPEQIQECSRRRYEPFFNQQAQGHKRALLLIAPDHARTVDPPPMAADRFGWVGLRFQYPQRTWPCGGAEFVGVMLMCQSYPETFNAGGEGTIPQPATPIDVTFGNQLLLRGITISLHGDAARPGGTLPVTLYWAAATPPGQDYRMFLHLCRDCDIPPLANDDGPPLNGYPPAGMTSTWRVGDPVHDERTLYLPRELPPGTYLLIMGVYGGDGSPSSRLPVSGAQTILANNRLILAEITISGETPTSTE